LGLGCHCRPTVFWLNSGSEEAVGQLLALSLLREPLPPVVTALLRCWARAGLLDCLKRFDESNGAVASYEMMGVDPLRRCDAPRLFAGVYFVCLLSLMFFSSGILGAAGSVVVGCYDGCFFGHRCKQSVSLDTDIMNGLIKAVNVFPVVVTWIAVFCIKV